MWATPDHDIQYGCLANHEVMLLQKNAEFPARMRDKMYSFDLLLLGDVERRMVEGRNLAAVLGAQPAGDDLISGLDVWRMSSPHSPLFGEEIPAAALSNPDAFMERGAVGLVSVDGEWLACARASEGEGPEAFRNLLVAGPGRDPRLLPEHIEADGQRDLPFSSLPAAIRETAADTWPIRGPRSVSSDARRVRLVRRVPRALGAPLRRRGANRVSHENTGCCASSYGSAASSTR